MLITPQCFQTQSNRVPLCIDLHDEPFDNLSEGCRKFDACLIGSCTKDFARKIEG